MLKENWRFISRAERLGDFIIVVLSFFAAYYGRSSLIYWNEILGFYFPFEGPDLLPIRDYFLILIVALLGYGLSLSALGSYSSMRLSSSWRLLRVSFFSSIFVFFLLAATLFLLKIDVSRSFVVLFCTLVTLSLAAERFLVLELLRFWRRRGKNYRNIILCGIGDQAIKFSREVIRRPELGIRIRAFADLAPLPLDEFRIRRERFRNRLKEENFELSVRLLQGVKAVETSLKNYPIDEIIFTDVVEVMPEVEDTLLLASEQGTRTTIVADLFSLGMVKSGLSYFGGVPLIHFQTPPGDRWELNVKRFLDAGISALLLIVLSPLLVLIALVIRITSPGPVLFIQKRMGLHGRLFNMYKFRSMQVDASAQLESLKLQNEMEGPAFKMQDDPRITRIGKILRRYSLDELPQLYNVLIGEMSLVGPRPPVPGEVSLYERRDRRRLSMRPGITCTWQVSGRNQIKRFEDWVKLDLEYIDNWSLARDFELMLRTIPAVIFGIGAR